MTDFVLRMKRMSILYNADIEVNFKGQIITVTDDKGNFVSQFFLDEKDFEKIVAECMATLRKKDSALINRALFLPLYQIFCIYSSGIYVFNRLRRYKRNIAILFHLTNVQLRSSNPSGHSLSINKCIASRSHFHSVPNF